jgi:RNA polymerase sigma-70 factor (ECF subfamily)
MSDLLVRVAQQDLMAFRAVFDHFAPRLKAFLMGQGTNPQMSEEVVQETMVKVWRKADQYEPARAAASTWIFTIARNLRIDHIRKANRPEPDMDDPAFVPEPEPLATETISRAQDAAQLHAAMSELSEDQRAVLQLAYFEEKAHPEIAETLGIPLGTVKSRIRLAMKNIRSKIGDSQ